GTAWLVSWPPSQSVSSVKITVCPAWAAAKAAAQPPSPPPRMTMSAFNSWLIRVDDLLRELWTCSRARSGGCAVPNHEIRRHADVAPGGVWVVQPPDQELHSLLTHSGPVEPDRCGFNSKAPVGFCLRESDERKVSGDFDSRFTGELVIRLIPFKGVAYDSRHTEILQLRDPPRVGKARETLRQLDHLDALMLRRGALAAGHLVLVGLPPKSEAVKSDLPVAQLDQVLHRIVSRHDVIGSDPVHLAPFDLSPADVDKGNPLSNEAEKLPRVRFRTEQDRTVRQPQLVDAVLVDAGLLVAVGPGDQEQVVPLAASLALDSQEERIVEVILLVREEGLVSKDTDQVVSPARQDLSRRIWRVAQLLHRLEHAAPRLFADGDTPATQSIDHHRNRSPRHPCEPCDIFLSGTSRLHRSHPGGLSGILLER